MRTIKSPFSFIKWSSQGHIPSEFNGDVAITKCFSEIELLALLASRQERAVYQVAGAGKKGVLL